MTPSKTKKALPLSTSITFPDHPVTLTHWRIMLQRVKNLYFQGRLKECSAQCSQLLSEVDGSPHPLHASYLHFYLALSTEGISRLSHNYSTTKIQLLKQAKLSYQAAASSLPVVENNKESHENLDSEKSFERVLKTPFTARPVLPVPSPTRPSSPAYSLCSPFSFDWGSPSKNEDDHDEEIYDEHKYSDVPQPSPLRIHKKVESYPLLPAINVSVLASQTLPSSPPQTPPPIVMTFTSSDATWLQAQAHHRFSGELVSFAEMLTAHIAVIDGLLVAAAESQATRHAAGGRRLPSYGADDETKAEDRKWRIARLREQGWRRPRFQPERYTVLCERALEELY